MRRNIFPIQGAMQVENRCVVQCLAVPVFRVRRGRYIGPLENAPNLQIFSSVQEKVPSASDPGSRLLEALLLSPFPAEFHFRASFKFQL